MSISALQTNQPAYYLASTHIATPSSQPASIDTTNSTSATSTNTTTPTKWGFSVDANGFFGTDFNTALGIPSNVKINEKMMEAEQKKDILFNKITYKI